MSSQDISADFPFKKQDVKVLDSSMAYVDTGATSTAGPIVVFVHGNPTSSYLWRNIIPHVSPLLRCIAPDLVGFGDSGKMPSKGYGVLEHITYFNAFMDAVIPAGQKVVLVVHDWGSALGLNWARENEKQTAGLVLMEFIYGSITPEDFQGWTTNLQRIRAEGSGLKLILEENFFLEHILGKDGSVREMTDAEMTEYRRPFLNPADRFPTWRFPNDIPFEGFAPEVREMIKTYWIWLRGSGHDQIPKLMFWANPGMLLPPWRVDDVAEWMGNVRTVELGPGHHFVQEDYPHVIGEETKKFVEEILRTA